MKLFSAFILILVLSIPTQTIAQVEFRVGGYMQSWLIANDYNESAFDTTNTWGYRLRRARMTGHASINDRLSATTWIEFASPNRNMLDFHFDYQFSPAANIRIGQFIPAGQTFDTARLVSSRLIFEERPQITRSISSTMGYDAFRDIGVMLYGTYGPIWYGVHTGNGMGRFTQASSNITSRTFGSGLYGFRTDITVMDGFTIGGHASINTQRDVVLNGSAPYDIDRRSISARLKTDGIGLDKLYTESEFAFGSRADNIEYDEQGFYSLAGFKVTPETHLLLRFEMFKREYSDKTLQETSGINIGALHFIYHDEKEISRIGINYRAGSTNPGSFDDHAIIAWVMVRFIPVR